MRTRKTQGTLALAATASLALAACGGGAGGPQSGGDSALTNDKIVIGLLNDQSGVYKDLSGPNSGVAIQMAIDDYKAKYGDDAVAKNIELIQADHQNKAEIANSKAQEMYDRQNADIILDVPNSAAALAVATQAEQKKKMYINIGAGTTALTGESCNKYTFHWAYNTAVLAGGSAGPITRAGGTSWNLVYPDYAFGQDLQKQFTTQIEKNGGTVGQSIPSPFPSDNFATFITKAGEGNPKVIGAMHAGGDLVNFVKQFKQSALNGKAELAVGLLTITDIHSLGGTGFAGVQYTDTWYWANDQENRDWAKRFNEKTNTYPSFGHAGNYSAALQYLEAVQEVGGDDADKIVANLEGKKINDVYLRNGEVRKEDHLVMHDVFLGKVKDKPSAEWEYVDIVETIPAAEAYPEPSAACKLA